MVMRRRSKTRRTDNVSLTGQMRRGGHARRGEQQQARRGGKDQRERGEEEDGVD